MHTRFLTAAVIAAVAIQAPAAHAQASSPLIGTWNIEYERGRRVENDVVTPVMGTATLTIQQRGDSLIATLVVPPRPDGTATPPSTAAAKAGSGSHVFRQQQEIRLNMNGEAITRTATLTWTLQADGDTLSGTLLREIADMPVAAEPTPVKGTRSKA